MEPTSREELNPLQKFHSMKDRVTALSEEPKARDHNMEAMYRGQIEDLQEDIQKKEQLVGEMEPTSREGSNPPQKFCSMKDRVTYVYEEVYEGLKARDRKMEAIYQGRIENLQKEIQKKEQLVNYFTDRVKELEIQLEEQDEELKARDRKMEAMYRGQIEELQEEIQKKEQLLNTSTDRVKKLENELKEQDSEIATLELECGKMKKELKEKDRKRLVLVTLAVTGAVVAACWWFVS